MMTSPQPRAAGLLALLPALAASLCCIGPVLALVAGVGSATSALAWVAPARPYLIALTVGALAWTWYRALTPQPTAAAGDCCVPAARPSFWQGRAFLALVTGLAGALLAFPYVAGRLAGGPPPPPVAVGRPAAGVRVVEFRVVGMTCDACTQHIRQEVMKLPGIEQLSVSYPRGRAVVAYRPTQTSIPQLTAAINATGYRVTHTLPANATAHH
jgi:mercuric ion transport protein